MALVKTVVLHEMDDVDLRLSELGLDRPGLMGIVRVAIAAGADTTQFFPANASGTLAYQHGTAALREEYVGDTWSLDRSDGVEAIRSDQTKVKVIFANVDLACDHQEHPKPRSRKGAGAERACVGNLFPDLPRFAPQSNEGWATYYLMVDESGAAELSRPVVRSGTFVAYVERIFLSANDPMEMISRELPHSSAIDEFDPQVVRKK